MLWNFELHHCTSEDPLFFAAYFRVSDLLEADEKSAKELLKAFCRFKGSWRYRARLLNRVCLARNTSTHAADLAMLDEMADTAAQHLRDYPEIRKVDPVASGIIDGYYHGGRKLIIQVPSL